MTGRAGLLRGKGPGWQRAAEAHGCGVTKRQIVRGAQFPAPSLIAENPSLFDGKSSLFNRTGKSGRERRIPRHSAAAVPAATADSRDFADLFAVRGNSAGRFAGRAPEPAARIIEYGP